MVTTQKRFNCRVSSATKQWGMENGKWKRPWASAIEMVERRNRSLKTSLTESSSSSLSKSLPPPPPPPSIANSKLGFLLFNFFCGNARGTGMAFETHRSLSITLTTLFNWTWRHHFKRPRAHIFVRYHLYDRPNNIMKKLPCWIWFGSNANWNRTYVITKYHH